MPDNPVTNPQPKARFMASAATIKIHRELMQNANLQHAIDMTLLQYQGRLCRSSQDANTAAASHFKMAGALEFIAEMKSLAENPPAPSVKAAGNLDHQA